MARTLNESEYTTRRNEILDAAQRLIYTRGYEQMTIHDLLGELRISKGAFYHYFESKPQLLEALLERSQEQAVRMLTPILQDNRLCALDKLRVYFDSVARWKTAQKAYLMAILRGWYNDHNAIVRQKMVAGGRQWITPALAEIIRQGVSEGVMDAPDPQRVSEVAVSLMINLGDAVAGMLLGLETQASQAERLACLERINQTTAAYTQALERILGAPHGSICLFDPEAMKAWVEPDEGDGLERKEHTS